MFIAKGVCLNVSVGVTKLDTPCIMYMLVVLELEQPMTCCRMVSFLYLELAYHQSLVYIFLTIQHNFALCLGRKFCLKCSCYMILMLSTKGKTPMWNSTSQNFYTSLASIGVSEI